MADQYNYQGETNEANNIDAVPITINGQNADLALSLIEAPTTAVLGQYIRTKWLVTNVGELATSSYGWSDRVVISDDMTLDSSDTDVTSVWSGYYNSYQPLGVQANYTVTQDLWIPATAVGDRYLLFVADGYNNQWETRETNNIVAVPLKVQAPDLVVTSVTAPNKSLPGELLEVEWTVKNQGDASATIGWSDSVYLSTDAKFDPYTDTNLKYASTGSLTPLAVNESYSVKQLLSLPNVPIGNYHLFFVANQTNYPPESNKSNNVSGVDIQLGELQPDLVTTFASSPNIATLGDTVEVSWTVKNQGNFTASSDWNDAIYISDDTTLDANDTLVRDFDASEKSPLAV